MYLVLESEAPAGCDGTVLGGGDIPLLSRRVLLQGHLQTWLAALSLRGGGAFAFGPSKVTGHCPASQSSLLVMHQPRRHTRSFSVAPQSSSSSCLLEIAFTQLLSVCGRVSGLA